MRVVFQYETIFSFVKIKMYILFDHFLEYLLWVKFLYSDIFKIYANTNETTILCIGHAIHYVKIDLLEHGTL